jgi:hypothetical protein
MEKGRWQMGMKEETPASSSFRAAKKLSSWKDIKCKKEKGKCNGIN